MPRTKTNDDDHILRGDVKFAFSHSTTSYKTTITLPPGSTWSASPHWHETHTEYLRVVRGVARVRLGEKMVTATAENGPIIVPRGTIHDWGRHSSHPEGDLVVEEWTDPSDGEKERFFRNLFSAIRDLTSSSPSARPPVGVHVFVPLEWWIGLQVMVISAAFDNYPVLCWEGTSGRALSRVCLLFLAFVGRVCGLQAEYAEYTPPSLQLPGKKSA